VRRVSVAALVAALAVLAAGCGGSKIAADEVPGSPVALTTPVDRQTPEGARPDSSSSSSDSSTDADSGDTSTSDQTGTDTGADTGAAATPAPAETPAPAAGGGTQDQTQQQGTAPAEPAPQGSDEQRFDEFCDQNAGAC
jgi:hypothetical protein